MIALKIFKQLFKSQIYDNTKMVILIRSDINMGKGKMASQAAHAAVSLYTISLKNRNPHLDVWLSMGQPKIVLKVDKNGNEILNGVYNDAVKAGLTACKIFDAGRTQIEQGSLTTIGIGPCKVEDVDKITKGFRLL